MNRRLFLHAASAVAVSPAAAGARQTGEAARADADIREVIAAMQAAWNRGDFRGYMAGFKNPDVVFVSNGRVQDDWQGTLDHYVRDYGDSADTRGVLRFYDMTIELLAPDAAQLVGSFRLERPRATLVGINTRLFRKVGGRWVIALNHVSAYEPDATAG